MYRLDLLVLLLAVSLRKGEARLVGRKLQACGNLCAAPATNPNTTGASCSDYVEYRLNFSHRLPQFNTEQTSWQYNFAMTRGVLNYSNALKYYGNANSQVLSGDALNGVTVKTQWCFLSQAEQNMMNFPYVISKRRDLISLNANDTHSMLYYFNSLQNAQIPEVGNWTFIRIISAQPDSPPPPSPPPPSPPPGAQLLFQRARMHRDIYESTVNYYKWPKTENC